MSDQMPLLEVDPYARRDEDFYATPAYQTRALVRRLPQLAEALVFEPCVGDGAIIRELPGTTSVLTNDLVPRGSFVPDFLLDATQAESWEAFARMARAVDEGIEVVLTNPPFHVAFAIAQLAYAHARAALILLLRLSWLEPTEERGPWLAAHPPTRVIVLPRHDYRGNRKTDSVTSAWMIWSKVPLFCAHGIDVVNWAEREELSR